MVWPEEGDNVALVLALGNFFHLLHGLAITEDVRPTVALLLVAEVVQDALWRRGRETYICGTAHGDVEDSWCWRRLPWRGISAVLAIESLNLGRGFQIVASLHISCDFQLSPMNWNQADGSWLVSPLLWSGSQCSFPILALRFMSNNVASIWEDLQMKAFAARLQEFFFTINQGVMTKGVSHFPCVQVDILLNIYLFKLYKKLIYAKKVYGFDLKIVWLVLPLLLENNALVTSLT
jgi:hypothetical protein